MMKIEEKIPELLLFGGPLHRLGCRLGLVRKEGQTIWLGIALSLCAWIVFIVLGFFQGLNDKIFTWGAIGIHVRFLVAIPLFFLCETIVAPRMQRFIENITHSGIVPENELPKLISAIRGINRLRNFWIIEALLFLFAFVIPAFKLFANIPVGTADLALVIQKAGVVFSGAPAWYAVFCLPLFRFLMLRWLWHLLLWWFFLLKIERLDLELIPTHSGGAAGLGYIEVVHEHFMPLMLAISAVFSASCAEGIISGAMAFEALYQVVPLVMLLNALLFIFPLVMFSRKLWLCRDKGLNEYMIMAHRYVEAFDHKWLRNKNSSGESQLGSSDLQSLADLTNSIQVVQNMRWIPISRRLIIELATTILLPFIPLIFLKFRLDEVSAKLFQMLTGL